MSPLRTGEAVKSILKKDGVKGLFGRGLKTRLITNIAQSMVFSVFWKAIEKKLNDAAKTKEAKQSGSGKKTGSLTLATLPALKGGATLSPPVTQSP